MYLTVAHLRETIAYPCAKKLIEDVPQLSISLNNLICFEFITKEIARATINNQQIFLSDSARKRETKSIITDLFDNTGSEMKGKLFFVYFYHCKNKNRLFCEICINILNVS